MLTAGGARLAGGAAGGSHQGRGLADRPDRRRVRGGRTARRGAHDADRAGVAHDRVGRRRRCATPIGRVPRRAIAMRSRQPASGDPGRGVRRRWRRRRTGTPPAWAQSLARRQRTTQAGLVAAQALREGDRPAAGSRPGSQGQELRERWR